ncbi:hypothetical protein [Staphylococcus nepalensis]|uniref:hypothetical protein n=1 Tax=Staphylococcus nepalensis TaxID=214473 RepID=UPI00383A9CCA
MHYCDRDFENRLIIQNNQIEATFKTSFFMFRKTNQSDAPKLALLAINTNISYL